MNDTSLAMIENSRVEFLKKYSLDEASIQEFKRGINSVSEEEANLLGEELYEMISKKGYNDDFTKAVELIKKGANIEYKTENKGDFPLLICGRKNYFKTFMSLLKAGANIDQTNNYLTTTVMACARHGNKEMLEILINMGADVNARCIDGDTAIMSAKRHSQVYCFDLLVDARAFLGNKNLMNQSVMDLPSVADFDFSKLYEDYATKTEPDVTYEDTQNIIEEAIKKMEKINSLH